MGQRRVFTWVSRLIAAGTASALSVFFVAAAVFSATTISTDITTGGTLTVTGAASFGGTVTVTGLTTVVYASSTSQSLTGTLMVNGNATTTSNGNIATQGTLTVVGLSTLSGAVVVNNASSTITNLAMINSTTTNATTTYLAVTGLASTSRLVVSSNSATSTFAWGLSANLLSVTSAIASSTFANGINLTSGCFSISDTCVGGGSVSLSSANTWTALQIFNANASTTLLSTTGNFMVNGRATTTASNGNIATQGDLSVTGAVYASSTLSVTATATFNGTASTTNLVVGSGTTIANVVFGTCNIATTLIPDNTTGNPKVVACTGATGVTSGSRVFVMATSSLPLQLVIRAASSTSANTIGVEFVNEGTQGGSDANTGNVMLNFFAIR